ncbi:MAG: hypothetical protein EXS16_05980 [Gemmataceae bacterium]|nr:hypothetical protein [Gemmataceae bacterium]
MAIPFTPVRHTISMAAKAKAAPKMVPAKPVSSSAPGQPLTMEERLHRIAALGKRIESYIQFMCQVPALSGNSPEVQGRAVTAFYNQLVLVEGQLAHIHDELRLE